MEKIQNLYKQIIERSTNPTDLLLEINDLYSVQLLIANEIFKMESNMQNRSLLIDSIKAMTNKYINNLMKIVTDNELNTIEK